MTLVRFPTQQQQIGKPIGSVHWQPQSIGLLPLILYGFVGTVEQLFIAPFQGQIPLFGGFTLETPLSNDSIGYEVGNPGLSPDLQLIAHLRGQNIVQGLPFRTHTTGLIDYGVRHGIPGSESAMEWIHPGRVEDIHREREVPMGPEIVVGPFMDMGSGDRGDGIAEDFAPRLGALPSTDKALVMPDTGSSGGEWWDDPECVSSALGFSSPKSGSSGGIVNDYTRRGIIRI